MKELTKPFNFSIPIHFQSFLIFCNNTEINRNTETKCVNATIQRYVLEVTRESIFEQFSKSIYSGVFFQ